MFSLITEVECSVYGRGLGRIIHLKRCEPEERTSEHLPLDVSSWKSHSNSLSINFYLLSTTFLIEICINSVNLG